MKWRWGFLGASRIGRTALAPAIAALPGHTLEAVAARDPVRAIAYAAECGFARAHASYEALLADPGIDAVYITLANDAHLPWTLRALEAGKPVLCEKPLALNTAEVARMAAAEHGDARVMEAFCHIHHPQMDHARALIANGALGRVIAIQASFGAKITNAHDFRWHASQGGGALLDLGTYCVSAFRVLLGREPVAASTVRQLRGDVDLDTTAQLDFGDGVAAQFTCSFDSARGQSLQVIGTEEKLVLDWPFSTKNRVASLRLGEARTEFPVIDPYQAMVLDFAGAIVTGGPMRDGIDASLRQAEALDMISSATIG